MAQPRLFGPPTSGTDDSDLEDQPADLVLVDDMEAEHAPLEPVIAAVDAAGLVRQTCYLAQSRS